MELRNVRSFVAVAEQLSFRAAARKLYLSQPALTKQVQQLEAEIGVPLLIRQRPHIVLTEAGLAFLDRAKDLLRASNFAIEEAKQIQAGLAGSITIGFVAQAAFETLPDLLKKFRCKVPSADFRLKELSATEQMASLADGSIDVALLQSSSAPKGFDSMVLKSERVAIVHSVRHRLAKEAKVVLKDFADDIVFLPRRDEAADLREIILANFSRHGSTPARIQEIERVQSTICLAAANLGIALIPESAKAMRMQGVRFRPLLRPFVPIETRAVWRRKERSALVNVLKTLLAK
ncbi:MAG: LysR substrate-binding domain-containing protein [Edaphobacter sp.]|uniref:LysR substrate-binding domain-containing protein n=1 Tax=Edaphobacter sp. TaxID=1934404 RepID=UPI00239F96BF|nr:LysR substrate-binding domain-containing protein [Edaphobacter sp.]MDE1178290.1 LysR substrate-binding domain-containing protein [Edaphobacter sp.]